MRFTLFGSNDATCAGEPAFTSNVAVQGNGTYTSAPYVARAAGTYRWVASYSGDGDDPPASTPCADPAQQVQVAAAPKAPTSARPCDLLAKLQGRLVPALGGFGLPVPPAVRDRANAPLGRALQICGP